MNQSERERMLAQKSQLQNPYAYIEQLEEEVDAPRRLVSPIAARSQRKRLTRHQIAARVAPIHRDLWNRRHELLSVGDQFDPVDLLEPSIAIRLAGLDFQLVDSLGEFYGEGRRAEAAGSIDREARLVKISGRQLLPVQRFTAAHELGHWILHPNGGGVHRDFPLDGSQYVRDQDEVEANQFATEFLMPPNLVRERFLCLFLQVPFSINEQTAFALGGRTQKSGFDVCHTSRGLSLHLASIQHYNGSHFISLATQFKVSKTAMAIRIEELGLLG